ncbi:MAG: alpha-amylase family glycosyl hydrolase [Actinomycetota bacterium]
MPTAKDAGPQSSIWWRDGVLYHVYLRSFADADGDGVGDIPGLIGKLEHLAWLGVDGVWVSPVMPSPNDDWGYDIADYTAVDPQYGTQEDVDRLIAEADARGMRVLFDLVPNHSSTAHPWFAESRSSLSSPKRDWYVWADPKPDGSPPNNWVGNFFGPSWTLDEATGQYYLSSFLPTQADLNWWNPAVRQAFDDVLRYWFDRGVAGFRIDVVHKLIKDPGLPDNPPAGKADSVIEQAWGQRELYNANQPETHDIIRRWRGVAHSYDEPPILVGETYVLDIPLMASYYGAGDELDLAFNIPFLWASLDAGGMRSVIEATEDALPAGAWPVWNGGSHDISRMATRWAGNDERKIRCALMLLVLLRGTPLLYYGDEIGMPDGDVPLDRALDPLGRRIPGVVTAGRDPARTPMQWEGGDGAGFTRAGVEPWLPLGDAAACNVADQMADEGSVLNLARDLIALRREASPSAARTEWIEAPPGVLAWQRGHTRIAINLSDEGSVIEGAAGRVRIGTRRERDGEIVAGSLRLAAWEGVVI